jgi:hypothetical protein
LSQEQVPSLLIQHLPNRLRFTLQQKIARAAQGRYGNRTHLNLVLLLLLRHEELVEDGCGAARRADVVVRHVHVQVLEGATRDPRDLVRERLHLLQVQPEDVRKPSWTIREI